MTTAPCWRKPKAQRVDEKVNKLLKGYNDAGSRALTVSDNQRRDNRIQKYFPGKDIPLGKRAEEDSQGEFLAIQN